MFKCFSLTEYVPLRMIVWNIGFPESNSMNYARDTIKDGSHMWPINMTSCVEMAFSGWLKLVQTMPWDTGIFLGQKWYCLDPISEDNGQLMALHREVHKRHRLCLLRWLVCAAFWNPGDILEISKSTYWSIDIKQTPPLTCQYKLTIFNKTIAGTPSNPWPS